MRIFGWLQLAFIVLSALASRATQAIADQPVVVSCDGFALGYDGQAHQRKCMTAEVSDGTQTMKSQELIVIDQRFFLLVNFIDSGYRTYLSERSLPDMAEDGKLFRSTTDWQQKQSILGLDVAAFTGVLKGTQSDNECAIFSRYSGNPGNQYDSSLGPAYKKHVVGYYCVVPDSLTPAQQAEGFYPLVQAVLAKLRLPAAE